MGSALSSAVEFESLTETAQKLHYGCAHYSQSFIHDFRVSVQNSHVLFGIFLHHQQHTFDTKERLGTLLVTGLMALGLTFFAQALLLDYSELSEEPALKMFLTIFFAICLQAPYDAALNFFSKCNCVQTWTKNEQLKQFLDGCGCTLVR